MTRPSAISGANLRQDGSDVFVRQAVKAVSLHAGLANFARQRNELGHRRLSTMETGIEAGHLRHVGQLFKDGFDGREIVRLMKRRKGNQFLEFCENLPVSRRVGPSKTTPAVDDAMTDTQHS